MDKKIEQLTQNLQGMNGGHIFYYTNELNLYIQNSISYIISGIEQGDHILFLENDRIYPLIQNRLEKLLTKEQFTKIHFINNFDFYWQNNNFHPPTIVSYFSDILNSYEKDNISIRTWGHVEWGNQKEIMQDIEDYEKQVNHMLHGKNVISVCAYDAERVPDILKTKLLKTHDFLMTDNDILCLNHSIN